MKFFSAPLAPLCLIISKIFAKALYTNQNLSETGPFENQYTHDSLYNRQSKNSTPYQVNALNQVTQAESSYTYDLNGQRLSKDDNRYAYNALGHLIAHNDVQFQYDALGRRIACHTAQESTTYLYQFDQEIASFSNNACTLRLIHKEAPLAYVLNNQLYTPIHNHRGDLCQLLYNNQVRTNVRYDAFGLFELEGLFCPYLFFGQRYDAFTGLFHFAQREYDPQLGCFLTPDPLGFADGPNLYAYVKNNPHRYVDPQGLFWEESKDFFNGSCRGAIDDASWGASEYLIGSYQAPSAYATAGYYTGMGVSMAMGFFYGTTEARLAGLALRHIPQVAKCVSAVKSLGRRTIDLVKHSSVVEKTSSFVKGLFNIGRKTEQVVETAAKAPLTPNALREYLGNAPFLKKEQIMEDLEKIGLHLKGKKSHSWMEFADKSGKVRVKIHPPAKKVDFHHLHVYDKCGNSLNKDLMRVPYNSMEAHIPYGGP